MLIAGSCCCTDYWVRTLGGGVSAWRQMRNSGTYPNNSISIKEDPKLTFATKAHRFTIDYRNKLIFTWRAVTNTFFIDRYDFKGNLVGNIHSATFTVGGNFGGLCCDWNTGRVFYITCSGAPASNTFEYQIRAVNYDGTGDTLLRTETISDDGSQFIGHLVWEPVNNYLFYVVQRDVETEKVFAAGPSPVTDVNLYAAIHRISAAGGGGHTEVVTHENTTDLAGDSSIAGLAVAPRLGKLLWVELLQTSSGSPASGIITNQYLRYSNLNGTGVATIYSNSQSPDLTNLAISECRFNDRDGGVYFRYRDTVAGVSYFVRLPVSAGQTLGDFQVQFNDGQAAFTDTGYIGAANFMFGCGTEDDGADYAGGSLASNSN